MQQFQNYNQENLNKLLKLGTLIKPHCVLLYGFK